MEHISGKEYENKMKGCLEAALFKLVLDKSKITKKYFLLYLLYKNY